MKRTELKRSRPKPKPWMSAETRDIAFWRSGGYCACGCGKPVEPDNPACFHHVLPKGTGKWPELADEPDNVVALAVDCHANQEAGSKRLSRKVIASAERLAVTPQMKSFLARTYPDRFDEAHARLKRELPNASGQGVQ